MSLNGADLQQVGIHGDEEVVQVRGRLSRQDLNNYIGGVFALMGGRSLSPASRPPMQLNRPYHLELCHRALHSNCFAAGSSTA